MSHPTHAVHHPELLERLRALCLALPEVTEKLSHGSPTWFVKKTFVTWVDDHHGDGVTGFWCAAPPGVQEELVGSGDPRFFRPPYVGGRGWLGVRLVTADGDPDWDEVAELVEDAYRTVARPGCSVPSAPDRACELPTRWSSRRACRRTMRGPAGRPLPWSGEAVAGARVRPEGRVGAGAPRLGVWLASPVTTSRTWPGSPGST